MNENEQLKVAVKEYVEVAMAVRELRSDIKRHEAALESLRQSLEGMTAEEVRAKNDLQSLPPGDEFPITHRFLVGGNLLRVEWRSNCVCTVGFKPFTEVK